MNHVYRYIRVCFQKCIYQNMEFFFKFTIENYFQEIRIKKEKLRTIKNYAFSNTNQVLDKLWSK